MDGFWAAPPVTRTYAAAIFIVSLTVAVKLLEPYYILYDRAFIFKAIPEVWRILTSFCFAQGLEMIFLPYSLWQYAIPLERESSRFTSASFLVYLLFVGTVIIVSPLFWIYSRIVVAIVHLGYLLVQPHSSCRVSWNRGRSPSRHARDYHWDGSSGGWEWWDVRLRIAVLRPNLNAGDNGALHTNREIDTVLAGEYFKMPILTGPMILAIAYTFAQENRGRQINFFFIPMDVKYLPWAILLLALVQGGSGYAMIEATGIVAAHLYDFLTIHWPRYGGGQSLIPTPSFIERWFENVQGAKQVNVKGHGTAYRAAPQPNTPVSSASGVSNPLSFRGTGRRLGGD